MGRAFAVTLLGEEGQRAVGKARFDPPGLPRVLSDGQVLAEGWPVVAEGGLVWDGWAATPTAVPANHPLVWADVGGERIEGGGLALVGSRAVAELKVDGQTVAGPLLWPQTTSVRGTGGKGLTIVGYTAEGVEETWEVRQVKGSGCGCGGR